MRAAATRAGEVAQASAFELPAAIAYTTAGVVRARNRGIEGARGAAAQAHVGHRRQDAIGGHPVDAGDHARRGARAGAAEHPYRVQRDRFRHTVGGPADGPGHVRAVAVAVVGALAVAHGREAVADPARELRVGRPEAGVDDVGVDARAGLLVDVGSVQRQVALVDAVEAPGGPGLRGDGLHHAVLLDERDAVVVGELLGLGGGRLHGEAAQRVLEDAGAPPRPGMSTISVATSETLGSRDRRSRTSRTASWRSTTMYDPGIGRACLRIGPASRTLEAATRRRTALPKRFAMLSTSRVRVLNSATDRG